MATSTLLHRQFIRQDFETITEIQHWKIIFLYNIILPTFLKDHDKTSKTDIIPGYIRGKRPFKHTDTWHQETRPWPPNPTCRFWWVYLGHRGMPRAQHTVNKDLGGCHKQYKHFLKMGKWFGQPFSPLKALGTFSLPAGHVDRSFK